MRFSYVSAAGRPCAYMMPPADTGARRSVPDAWQALRPAHLIPSCRDHRRRTNKRGGGHVSKGGGLLFEARSPAGPSAGVTRERAWLIVPAVMEQLRGALYAHEDPLRDRIGRFCRNTLFSGLFVLRLHRPFSQWHLSPVTFNHKEHLDLHLH